MELASLFGLGAALLYGVSDLLARVVGPRAGVLRMLFYGHAACTLVLGTALLARGLPQASLGIWLLALGCNLAALAGTACLYRALSTGRVAVVSPVTATYGAVTALISGLLGEHLPALGWVGLALTASGGALAALPGEDIDGGHGGAGLAALASLLYGVAFLLYGRVVLPRLGVLAAVTFYYATGLVATFLLARLRGQRLALTPGTLGLVLVTTMLACGGTLALAQAQHTGHVAIATVLSALASGITVVLARLLLHETMRNLTWAGVSLVVLGLMLLHAS